MVAGLMTDRCCHGAAFLLIHTYFTARNVYMHMDLQDAGYAATGEERKLDVRGLFYGIGHQPNSHLVQGQVELDDKGYVKVRWHPVARYKTPAEKQAFCTILRCFSPTC